MPGMDVTAVVTQELRLGDESHGKEGTWMQRNEHSFLSTTERKEPWHLGGDNAFGDEEASVQVKFSS